MLASKLALGAQAMDGRDRFDPEVRRKFMNASEAETCLRRQWYARNKPELAEEQSWGYARRGHYGEKYIVDALRLANCDVRLVGDEQKSLQIGNISGTPDGVLVDHENERLIVCEFKTIDPRANKRKLPKAEHVTQIMLNMCLIDEHAVSLGLPDWTVSHGQILYVDASNYDDVLEKVVPYAPDFIDGMQQRGEKMLKTRSVNTINREGKLKGGAECKRCPFAETCLSGDDIEAGTLSRAAPKGTRLDNSVKAYWNQKLVKEEADAGMKEEAERIKAELKRRKVNEIDVGDRHVKMTAVAGRRTLDKKALADAGVNVEDFEKVGAPSERLTVT